MKPPIHPLGTLARACLRLTTDRRHFAAIKPRYCTGFKLLP
jgi:hypothetical protein